MVRRAWILGASLLGLACGDDAATTGSETSAGSTDTGTSITTFEPSTGPDSATSTPPGTGSASSDGTTDATSGGTTDATTTGLDSSTGAIGECGNTTIEGDEVCDATELQGEDCVSQGFVGGELACLLDCSGYDTSSCTMASCGDGMAEGTELCDGADLGGASCQSEGFDSGTLSCNGDCASFDTGDCGTCGNVIVDGDEACDGVALLGQTCLTQGFEHGEIACAADCLSFDTSGCGLCGDGSVGGSEACDGADLGGQSCMSLGYGGGMLACQPTCLYDLSGCDAIPEVYDFPTAADPRFTATGVDLPWNAGDWFEGVRMTGVPSIGQLDIHLEVVSNILSPCGVQEAEVSVNGVAVGTFQIVQGTTAIDQSFPVVPSIAGPNYTVRYETTMTVAGGCGSAGYGEVGSTVTFFPG